MEVDQIHCSNKFPKTNNGGFQNFASTKLGKMDEQDDEGDNNNRSIVAADAGGDGRLYGWPSSRIVRVSRASGGKDRHSKVLTSKGLRDRRVRLSVNTAIQFYDLQDRLGYDQPSKAVEWLLAAAAGAIDELPPMNTNFLNNERISGGIGRYQFDSAAAGGGGHYLEAAARVSISSPPGSSNSGSSKGSGISSISRSESRMKARERAKERVEKEKEKENDSSPYVTSFTELLGGRNNGGGSDYFTSGLFGPPPAPVFSVTAEHHHHSLELQPFSFAPPAFNRGTLQSNSSSTPPPSIFPPSPSFYSGVDNHHHQHFTGFWQKEKEKN